MLADVVIARQSLKKLFSSGVVNLGISDHSLIYGIRKILNIRIKTEFQSSVEYKNFTNFNISCFLYELQNIQGLPWEEIRFKRNIDEMWKWKTFFVGVLDKHAPMKVKKKI